MTIAISLEHNAYRLAGTLTHLNLGAGVARVLIFGNVRPGSVYDLPGEDPLVELPLLDPAGAVDEAGLTLAPGEPGLILTSGVASWARVVNGNGDVSFDCDVSLTGGTATVRLVTLNLYAGGNTRITSAVLN